MNNVLISWKAKWKDCVTLSSAEAEYVVASMCWQEVIYLWALLRGFGCKQLAPTVVWEDNTTCIQMANNPVNRKFTLHINMHCYFVWDLVCDGALTLVKCAGPGMATSSPVSDWDAAGVPGVLLPVGIQLAYSCNSGCGLRRGVSEACRVPSSRGGGASTLSGGGELFNLKGHPLRGRVKSCDSSLSRGVPVGTAELGHDGSRDLTGIGRV
eukprot:2193405-Rhodomonas_salina.1